jgi:hypothetical protein
MPLAEQSQARVRGSSLTGIAFSYIAETLMYVCWECCVLSGTGLCVSLITSPGESYRAWCVWVWSWSLENEKINPSTGLDRPLGFQEVETPRLSRRSAHECGKVVSPMHRPPLPLKRYPWYSVLLDAESSVAGKIKASDNVGNRTNMYLRSVR